MQHFCCLHGIKRNKTVVDAVAQRTNKAVTTYKLVALIGLANKGYLMMLTTMMLGIGVADGGYAPATLT